MAISLRRIVSEEHIYKEDVADAVVKALRPYSHVRRTPAGHTNFKSTRGMIYKTTIQTSSEGYDCIIPGLPGGRVEVYKTQEGGTNIRIHSLSGTPKKDVSELIEIIRNAIRKEKSGQEKTEKSSLENALIDMKRKHGGRRR